jgi:hypothetical protein
MTLKPWFGCCYVLILYWVGSGTVPPWTGGWGAGIASVDGNGSLDTRGLAFPVKYKTAALTAAPTTTVLAKVRRAVFPDGSSLVV